MSTLASRTNDQLFKGLLVGYPGTGKTGALACLANAGYNIRILDFDGNIEPLARYVRPEFRENVEIVALEDRLKMGPRRVEPLGIPTAFATALKLLDNWKYKEGEREVDFGPVTKWTSDDILVLDSLTGMGRAAFRRTIVLNGRTGDKLPRIQDWGAAMGDQEALIELLTSASVPCHVIVTAHLVMIGPDIAEADDDEATKAVKERELKLVPTKLYPSALGRTLPPKIAEHFPITLMAEAKTSGNTIKRVLSFAPRKEVDLKLPWADLLPPELPIEDGLLTVFRTMKGQRT